MKAAARHPWADRRGQALAEFALVLPLVLMFIAAILEFGRAWNVKQAVTDAAREGARYTVVRNTMTLAQVEDKIEERLALASIDSSTITISSPDAACAVLANCFHTAVGTGKEMTVNVSTQHRIPLVHVLLNWTGAPTSVTIATQATMRGE